MVRKYFPVCIEQVFFKCIFLLVFVIHLSIHSIWQRFLMNRELILMLLNSHGWNSAIKCTKCLEYIRCKYVDIALIQETHLKHSDVCRFQDRYYKCVAHSSATNKTNGVLILFGRKLCVQDDCSDNDDADRFVFVTTVINHTKMCFSSIYCPNIPDSNFLSYILKRIRTCSGRRF